MDFSLIAYILGSNLLTALVLYAIYTRRLTYFKGLITANYKADFEALATIMLSDAEQTAPPKGAMVMTDKELTARLRNAGVM